MLFKAPRSKEDSFQILVSVLCILYSTNPTLQNCRWHPDGSVGREASCQCRRHETRVRALGPVDPLEKEMATHSSILPWRIPWMEKPSRLQSMGSQKVGHDWATSPSPSPNRAVPNKASHWRGYCFPLGPVCPGLHGLTQAWCLQLILPVPGPRPWDLFQRDWLALSGSFILRH